jgi:hypothetical protein
MDLNEWERNQEWLTQELREVIRGWVRSISPGSAYHRRLVFSSIDTDKQKAVKRRSSLAVRVRSVVKRWLY